MSQGKSATEVVSALGGAWTTAGLYADVAHREPFQAAVERIAKAGAPSLGVRSDGFIVSGEPLAGPDAAARLASALFVHGAETVLFDGALTPESLAGFFRIVSLAPDVVADRGGLAAMVAEASLPGVTVRLRPMLGGFEADGEGLAPTLGDEDVALGSVFLDRLEAVASHGDMDERTVAMLDLVDRFSRLEATERAELVDRLLGSPRTDIRDLFLDQLAPNDLAEVVAHLDPAALGVLGEYVAYVDGARRGELAEAIGDPGSILRFRERVAESVRDRMQGIRLARPTSGMPDLAVDRAGWFDAAIDVFGGLVLVEDRPDRVAALAATWTSRVGEAIAGHEDERALAWWRSVADLDAPPAVIAEALEVVPDLGQIKELVARRAAGRAGAAAFVDLLLGSDPVRVLGPLAASGDAAEHLAKLAAIDPDALISALDGTDDPVPIVLALKTAGYRGADPRLVDLLDEPTTNGRSEVLVLVGPSLGVERLGRLLQDPDPSVRRLAAEHLRRGRTPVGAKLLFDRFVSEDLDDDERLVLAHLLADTSDGEALLSSVAGKASLLLSGAGRKVRQAAKTAMDAKGSRP